MLSLAWQWVNAKRQSAAIWENPKIIKERWKKDLYFTKVIELHKDFAQETEVYQE